MVYILTHDEYILTLNKIIFTVRFNKTKSLIIKIVTLFQFLKSKKIPYSKVLINMLRLI